MSSMYSKDWWYSDPLILLLDNKFGHKGRVLLVSTLALSVTRAFTNMDK